MTACRPPSLPRAARHCQCGCGRLPSRLADTTHDAEVRTLNRSADMFVCCNRNSRHNIWSSSQDRYMTLGWDNPTAVPTTTILLRHGDTRLSPEHRFSGLRDLPLSASGKRQAQAAACRLATGAPIDAVVSSPLQRAVDTAAIAAAELGLTAV